MNRYEQWDIVSGIGVTALSVAAARAIETRRPDALIQDPYAAAFVTAARVPEDSRMMVPPLDGDFSGLPADHAAMLEGLTGYAAVRYRFFDDYFAEALAGGVEQAVIVAAGLDTRAFRLSWPADFAVFEVDQPLVLEFKAEVLREQGATPGCAWHTVPADLREDWPAALLAAGFDPSRPTAWLAEGLLPYLPAAAEQQLLDTIDGLSAPGSFLSAEVVDAAARENFFHHESGQPGAEVLDRLATLWNSEPRPAVAKVLEGGGWTVRTSQATPVAAGYGRPLLGFMAVAGDLTDYLVAHR